MLLQTWYHSSAQYSQLIRIRSKDGNFRYEFSPEAEMSDLLAKVPSKFRCNANLTLFPDYRNGHES